MDHQAAPAGTGPAGDGPAQDSPPQDIPAQDTPARDGLAQDGPARAEAATSDQALAAAEVTAPDTGEQRVDAVLGLLDQLTGLPVTEHAAIFERVHARLTDVLGELDPESAGTDG